MESQVRYCNKCVDSSRYQEKQCHFNRTTSLLGQKWVLPLLFELCLKKTPLRFNALQKRLYPITPKILADRLKAMEGEGLLERREENSGKIQTVEYALTVKSRELLSTLKALGEWSEKWHGREGEGIKCPNVRKLSCAEL